MNEKLNELKHILKDMFQMNNSDLDFGIYRIMNMKNCQIMEFFDTKLNSIQLAPKEQDIIYSNMIEFFSRYYQDGDFISQRRYSDKNSYAIPYNGEEVKLHWANADQYYIKTGEYFKNYTFKTKYATVDFKVNEADSSKDNNKSEKRYFVFKSVKEKEKHLIVYFEYKDPKQKGQKLQEKLNRDSFEKIEESIALSSYGLNDIIEHPIDKKRNKTLLEQHLGKYTARNSFDYFIHKNLGKFLRGELDNFIKSELINLDDILGSTDEIKKVKFDRVKIFKDLSLEVITFLAQLEEFQKQLWEKKKFVINSNYCITLDKINEDYYEEIFTCKEQLAKWKELFDVEIQSVDDLKEEQYLLLDTVFFDTKFKYKILGEFDNLDETIDGVLINSENFGALNLLQDRYKEQVKTVYIDPPYNTGSDGFLYNDNYQHSSWMSFMYDRLALSRELMSDDGVIFSSIDDREFSNLDYIVESIFDIKNKISNLIWKKKKQPSFLSQVATVTEYISVYAKKKELIKKLSIEKISDTTKRIDNATNGISERIIESGIECKSIVNGIIKKGVYQNKTMCTEFLDNITIKDGITQNPFTAKANFRNKQDDITKFCLEKLLFLTEKNSFRRYTSEEEKNKNKSITNLLLDWGDNQDSNNEMMNIFGSNVGFSYPKPMQLISNLIKSTLYNKGVFLDYFTGSGTTGHAVINLNREDNGKRKYLLVEMGEYFDSVTKLRIQKAIYSDSWKDGKPTTKNGVSQMFKYFCLESYEDTLNNLEIKQKNNILDSYRDEYMLNYILDDEMKTSKLDIDRFNNPFNYTIEMLNGIVGESKAIEVDLVETFNYLLGLKVKTIKHIDDCVVVCGETLDSNTILVVWKNEETAIPKDVISTFKSFEKVYINGDVDLDEENIYLTEKEFYALMFKGL